jgi:mannosyltransferase
MTQQLDRAHAGVAAGSRRLLTGAWAPAVPAVLTMLVVGFQLGRAPLWRDELATWSAASRPLPDLWRMLAGIDAVTGPYYAFMHGWTALFGDSVVALRLPSLLAMAGAAAVTTRLGTDLFGPRAGLLAGSLFAVVPSTSRYGQEARAYAFAALFAALATLLLVRAVRRPDARRFAGYGAALLALGLSNVVALLLVAGHATAVLPGRRAAVGPVASRRPAVGSAGSRRPAVGSAGSHRPAVGSASRRPAVGSADRDRAPAVGSASRRRAVVGFAGTVGAVGVLLAPLLWRGHGQQGVQLGWVGTPGPGNLVELPGSVLQAQAVGGALLVLAALGWALTGGRWATVLALSVAAPAVLLFAAGQVAPFWVPRYLLFTVALLCVLVAGALTRVRLPCALALVVVIAALGGPAQVALRRTHEWPRSAPVDYPAAVAVIRANARPGDGIVYEPRGGWRMLDVAVAYGLGGAAPRDVLVRQSAVERGELRATECGDPAGCLARAGAPRLWLLATGDRADPLATVPGKKGAALRAAYTNRQVWHEPGLTVALLTRR